MTKASLLPVVLVAVAAARAALAGGAPEDASLPARLRSVAARRVYFGHQSVGYGIMAGVAELSAQAGVPLRVAEVAGSLAGAPDGFLHGPVDVNGDPLRKLESFARAVDSAPAPGPDVALLKLCYVDFRAGTDAAALFARYQATLAGLRARHPGTTFVHFTAPLTTVQGGLKASLKRLLGRRPYGAAENLVREEYNALLRGAYQGREPLVDVARIESTAPDGRPFRVEWDGRQVPALLPAYTDDGGHLNRAGRLRVARELIEALATAPAVGGQEGRR